MSGRNGLLEWMLWATCKRGQLWRRLPKCQQILSWETPDKKVWLSFVLEHHENLYEQNMTGSVFRLTDMLSIQWHLSRCGAQRAGRARIDWVCSMDTPSQSKVNNSSDRCYGIGTWKTWYKGHAAKGRLQRTEEGQIGQAGICDRQQQACLTNLPFLCPLQPAFCTTVKHLPMWK